MLHQRYDCVSTHSHPKVAAHLAILEHHIQKRFNSQPPEGGCMLRQPSVVT
ncbi:hypothetical protein WQG_14150 [Bibersteinia trehalosi USDA-ARS-USMARC-192]|nr:hypothetical protein WQG_14150 [Bibersteinia trehalosi USDA-ARS-USMARC-192]